MSKVLGIIPARFGSKGVLKKNIRPFCGIPLIGHTLLYGQSCKSIDRLIVSTDSQEIADVAKQYGAEVMMRPWQLAQDGTPVWDVIKDVLARAEQARLGMYDYVVLLEPTSPTRVANGVEDGLILMRNRSDADGVIAVSKYAYNPAWNAFTRDRAPNCYLEYLVPGGENKYQRQQVPDVWHHSGDYYIFATEFIRKNPKGYQFGQFIGYETLVNQAFSFDTVEEMDWAEKLVQAGLIKLPWLDKIWDTSKAVHL